MSSKDDAVDGSRTSTDPAEHPDGHAAATATSNGSAYAGTGEPVPVWRDRTMPVEERVFDLLGQMSLTEKVAQLYSFWMGANASVDDMAPHQHDLVDDSVDWSDLLHTGLGQLTRPFGTAAVTPIEGARALARLQTEIAAGNRFGIPALIHEECLTGFMTWGATVYPTPLAWGATFDPELVERMANRIGADMRSVGVHQGLAPVLDVARDPRWGRTEETIGEDPYLVATIGTAYVRGLESAGIVATLKHFAGYSASRAGRNFGPVAVGPREFADVLLPPFEMAVREGGARSVMHSYAEIDGVPSAADGGLLTDLLRGRWGFTGTVVADYFGVSFLELLHRVADGPSEAAALALTAGVDVELPAVRCFGTPLVAAVRKGTVPESVVDRAVTRVLRQKCELGLLDPDWDPTPPILASPAQTSADRPVDRTALDGPDNRKLARRLAEESVVLLANDGTLPLPPEARLAVVGPLADDVTGMLGCYTFPSHVGTTPAGVDDDLGIGTVLAGLRVELPQAVIEHVATGGVDLQDTPSIVVAADAAARAGICVAVVGDRAGLFGNGTSGEGSDAVDLELPGRQGELIEALVATGTPVVLVLLTGRPYALGRYADRLAAVVQAFFPGAEGGRAVAGVLGGRVCPSGHLPIGVPRTAGGQPAGYLSPPLGHRTEVSNIDPTPLYPFGHGLSYTTFEWSAPQIDGIDVPDPDSGGADHPASWLDTRPTEIGTDGAVDVSIRVRNTGTRAGTEVVQLYLHDPVAQVTRPVARLIGYARVPLEPGQERRVDFTVPADLAAFTGREGRLVVEPGDLHLRLAASSERTVRQVSIRLVGPYRQVDHRRRLTSQVTVR
ncbi:glycoside hydrolase family 3 N-terminal domain-containing protein [Solwaraspora sp. WMMD406]|uniref:glycoside hydrolase family 3 N-terminal domain-containing protein n=1 Tax=Solwaraspora sp. WMMD406 TaxID=3016095 RepID=UPI0024167FCA|nr:glycoside hydrolase family 3 N-terminal domain-containing protein [Solwaraspora sp. WMMD406]MDG4766277.1 glycoside hydrolase family 3 N-terminal domain-containing protein [Solwaraspora sp. WMMD406]